MLNHLPFRSIFFFSLLEEPRCDSSLQGKISGEKSGPVYACVCMYVCMYVCIYVHMYVWINSNNALEVQNIVQTKKTISGLSFGSPFVRGSIE